jgi:ubiquinone/menaquinone biosynthesis C-methylase UbiE
VQNLSITKQREPKNKTQKFYDRIADVHNLAMKINGYRTSAAKYFRTLKLDVPADSIILDAGCGTGLATLAFYEAGYRPKETYALDISFKSLEVAKEQFETDKIRAVRNVRPVQGNLLCMPFEDEKFDFVLTCGALEYVPLEKGLDELARVLKPNGVLVLIPVRPSLVGSMLEILYNFKIHSLAEVRKASSKHFQIIGNHKFPITEPIGWSKTIFLLRKK